MRTGECEPSHGGSRGTGELRVRGTSLCGRQPGWGAPVVLALSLLALSFGVARAGPTPEEYVSHVGGDAHIVPAGQLKLDGHRLVCGQRPTVMDNQLDDYGAAYPGFLILN